MTAADRPAVVSMQGFFTPLLAVVLLLVTHIALRESFAPGHAVRLAVTSLLILAFVWSVMTNVRLVRGLDELERRIHLEAVVIGYTAGVGMVFAVGLLRGEGLLAAADPRDLAMLLIAPYGLGLAIARRRYR